MHHGAVGGKIGHNGHIVRHRDGERVVGENVLVAGGDAPPLEAVAFVGCGKQHSLRVVASGMADNLGTSVRFIVDRHFQHKCRFFDESGEMVVPFRHGRV